MIQCQKCGQSNDGASNFCRFCGTNFAARPNPQPFAASDFNAAPPRPYAWKTDEFSNDPTRALGPNPMSQAGRMSTQPDLNLQPFVGQQMAAGYHCPQCNSRLMPRRERRISTGGWIVFGVLMLAFFPLFWVGLLIKEDIGVCPVCNYKFPVS